MAHYEVFVVTFPHFHEKFLEFFRQKRLEGHFRGKRGQDAIFREGRVYDCVIPEEKEKIFLEYMGLFAGEYMWPGRYGVRKKGFTGFIKLFLKAYKFICKIFFKKFMPFEPIDFQSHLHKRPREEYQKIRDERWFANAYPLVKIKDGYRTKENTDCKTRIGLEWE